MGIAPYLPSAIHSSIAMHTSDEIIETMIASLSEEASESDRRLFKNALRHLVKIAQAEQIEAIENDFETVYKVLRTS